MAQRKSKKIRRRASEALNDDDRLSRLPDDTWKSQPQLSTEIIRSPNRASGSKFPDFVHKFLSRREFQSNFIGLPLLREIIVYAMSHKTRKLRIEFSGDKKTRRGELDASLFRSRHLEQLFLSIKFDLKLSPPLIVDFPSLTTLNINHVNFILNDVSKSNDFCSQFPNLKTLALDGCWLFFDTFIIKSSKLETLSFINLHYISCKFVVSAPKLSSFTYKGFAKFSLSAKDLVSLKTVCFQTINEPQVTDWMHTFSQLCTAESLTLNLNVFKGLSEFPELLETRNCPFTSLQSLTLLSSQFPLSLAAFDGVLNYFRRSSPDLKIHIEHDPIPQGLLYTL
ncbi:uncharacterized protein LOC143572228 [Bidens hawaiensis]|uniref:uncharacterized protein LOC143572228 n=1 Tax=Bidens hawaiensis TaxID=980011 RepID=UPI00404B580F